VKYARSAGNETTNVVGRTRPLCGDGNSAYAKRRGAVAELRRCQRELGLRGIEIGTNIAGRDLHLADFEPVFAAAEELNMLVFLHPMGFTEASRLSDHHLNNLIGNPLDTSIALSHLIFGGVLDRHPGLKLCAAHGGGYLAAYSARMDHGYHARRDCREGIRLPPSEYLKRCTSIRSFTVRTTRGANQAMGRRPFMPRQRLPIRYGGT